MATLAHRFLRRDVPKGQEQRFGLSELMSITGGGGTFPSTTWQNQGEESTPASYEQYAMQLFASDPVVFAAAVTRLSVFSQATLRWRDQVTGDLFGNRDLATFERPWKGGTSSDLLGKMLLRSDLAGNAYVWNSGKRLHVWRPDWVSIILGSDIDNTHPEWAEDAEVVGYMYRPGGQQNTKPRLYMPGEVAHFAPIEDPTAHYRGMSWLTPVVRDIQADKAMTEHKWRFMQNAATPNMIVKFDASQTREQVATFKELLESEHSGYLNAYKNLYLGGGADATVVGSDFKQIDFASTQGKGESRILMAAGVHPTIVGASEGLAGSSLNAGNYMSAKRSFSDIRLQHLWRNAVASLETLTRTPANAELWFDVKRIPFLQDDLKDTADVQAKQAQAIKALTEAGYEPSSVVASINGDDIRLLKHTGVFSVQLQAPGAQSEGQK